MAPLLAEVEVALNERSSRSVADQLVGDFKKAGAVAGREFRSGLSDSMTSSQLNAFTSSFASSVAPQFQRHGRQAGEAFGRGFESSVGQIVTRVVTSLGLAGAASAVLYKGFERYEAIDAAKNRLDSLNRTMAGTGRAALDVGQVMETVTKTVEGTPFALDQAFSIATRALATNTGDLKRFMTDVADAAGFAGTDIGRVGDAFLDVANQGKVSMEQLGNQLQDIPIQAWLAETMHKSSAEISKMISAGKIGLDDLMSAVEQHAPGFAKAAGDTVQGAVSNMQTAIARLGANFLSAVFGKPTEDANGLVDVLKTLRERIDEVGAWVSAHQNDIREFFQSAIDVGGDLLRMIKEVIDTLGGTENAVKVVAGAFIAWKTVGVISTVAELAAKLGLINTTLQATPALAAAAGSSITAALPAIAIPAALVALLGGATVLGAKALDDYARDHPEATSAGTYGPGGAGRRNSRSIPGARDYDGGSFARQDGVSQRQLDDIASRTHDWTMPAGPGGLPFLDPTGAGGSTGLPKAPQIPYPAAYGQPPGPGESVEHWQARMAEIDAEHDLAEKRARVTQLQADANATADDVVKAQNDAVQAQIRATQTTEALRKADLQQVVAPYDPRYGVMRPGETAAQYGAESSFFEAQHDRAQAEADLKALQDSGTASTAELAAAQNKLIKARDNENQALLRLNETSNKTAKTMGDLGAQLDSDLGASKGLPGLAENLTKFLANLGFAPVLGALRGIQVANGFDQSDLGGGIIGALGATGAFGKQFVKDRSTDALSSGASTAAGSLNSLATAANAATGALGGGGSGGSDGASLPSLSSVMPGGGSSWWPGGTPAASTGGRVPYGLPRGSNSGGYGGGGVQFPDWVNQIAQQFGIKPSTYPGHQETNRSEAGFAPNPMDLNRAIDWSGPVPNMERFADYLATIPQDMEQVIWQNPQTGHRVGIAGGRDVSGSGYYADDFGGHQNHVHTRQSLSIPLPGGPLAAGSAGGGWASPRSAGGGGGGRGSAFGPGMAGLPQGLAPGFGIPGAPSILGMDPGGADPSQSVAGGRAYAQGVPGSGGIGFGGGLIGLAGSAAQSAMAVGGMAADAAGGGGGGSAGAAVASAAMQIGIQEIQRAAAAGGQYVGALAGGLLETFSLNDSALADPGKSWLGRIGVAVAGARPALPNSAGEMGGKENKNMAEGGKKPPGPMSPQQAKGGKGGQPGADGANGSNVGKGNGDTFNMSVVNNNNDTRFDPTHNDIQNMMSASQASRQPR